MNTDIAGWSAAAAVVGGLFLWAVRVIVENSVRRMMNGIKEEMAVLTTEMTSAKEEIRSLRDHRDEINDRWWERFSQLATDVERLKGQLEYRQRQQRET